MPHRRLLPILLLTLSINLGSVRGDEPKNVDPGTLLLIDANGKEVKLKTWKFVLGTRHLGWLVPEEKGSVDKGSGEKGSVDKGSTEKGSDKGSTEKPKDEQPKGSEDVEKTRPVGPEYLELREENSTNLVDGIVTLISMDRVRSIEFDGTKETVTVTVAVGNKKEDDVVLTGSTQFRQINKWTLECEVDKGELGLAAVKYLGGVQKGIKAIHFPTPKANPVAGGGGRSAALVANDTKKNEHKVTDLQALYSAEGGQKLATTLFFKSTLKIDLAKIQKVHAHAGKKNEDPEWDVTLKNGDTDTLTLIASDAKLDGKRAQLLGFVGKTAVGYKLFGLPSFTEITLPEEK